MLQYIQTLHGVIDYETHENQFSITDVKPGSMHQNWHSDDQLIYKRTQMTLKYLNELINYD